MKKTDPSKSNSPGILIGLLIFIFGGIFMGWNQYDEVKDLRLSKQWPVTQGRVQTSELGWDSNDAGGEYSSKFARISYSYSVGSQIYQGNISTRAMIFTSRVNRLSEKYPEGSQITVYYHPGNPSISIVEPGLDINLSEMIFSLVFILLGFWALWRYIRDLVNR